MQLERENHRFTIRQNWLAKLSLKRPQRIKEGLQHQNVSKDLRRKDQRKTQLTINNGNENERKAPTLQRVIEPREKRSKKDSTSGNGNENL